MVSSFNLAYMHLRLEELFGGHDWFGGRNVLFASVAANQRQFRV